MKKVTELTTLERVVYGNNLINNLSIQAIEKLLPQLQNFVGKKVMTVKQDKTSKFVIELLKVPFNSENGESYRSYLKFEYGNLVLFNDVTVKNKNYEGGGYGVNYYKREITLGVVDKNNGMLVSVNDFEHICSYNELNVVFNAEEQNKIKENIKQLEQQIRDLEYQLCKNPN
mgnify:CR=1 FL=1